MSGIRSLNEAASLIPFWPTYEHFGNKFWLQISANVRPGATDIAIRMAMVLQAEKGPRDLDEPQKFGHWPWVFGKLQFNSKSSVTKIRQKPIN